MDVPLNEPKFSTYSDDVPAEKPGEEEDDELPLDLLSAFDPVLGLLSCGGCWSTG